MSVLSTLLCRGRVDSMIEQRPQMSPEAREDVTRYNVRVD